MKTFCFTIDDNIRFLKEITERKYSSVFEHPYAAMLKRLHEKFGLKIQLNLFYRVDGFDLSKMSDAYRSEWKANADWLKLSFHSDYENVKPYEFSDYDEVYRDCKAVHDEILRFASPTSLAKTTTVHYCLATESGLQALCDNDVTGLLGLFGNEAEPQSSYGLDDISAARVRSGEIVFQKNMAFAPIDIVLNSYSKEKNLKLLFGLTDRDSIWVMIHEQYFYEDYIAYQPDFEEKLTAVFAFLTGHGYESCFFENLL